VTRVVVRGASESDAGVDSGASESDAGVGSGASWSAAGVDSGGHPGLKPRVR
jgi:hypothetical protein